MSERGTSSSTGSSSSIIIVTDHDVLCGRGVSIAKHPGNQRLRALARSRFDASYCTEFSTSEKKALADEIISHIQNLNPPGRFLKRAGRSTGDRGLEGPWEELTHKEAVKKACQALRDCNRQDREGYATKVEPPTDVVASAKDRERTGLSLKEHAAMAAMAKATVERETRTARPRTLKHSKSAQMTQLPTAVASPSATAVVTAAVAASTNQPMVTPHARSVSALSSFALENPAKSNIRQTPFGTRSSSSTPNVKSDPSVQRRCVHQVASSSSSRNTTSPTLKATATTSTALSISTRASLVPPVLDPIQTDPHHTPLDPFRHVYHDGKNMAVPVSASHHSGSPFRGTNIFGDDCPASPGGMDGHGGNELPTATRLVVSLTAPFSPVTWNHHDKSTDDNNDVDIPLDDDFDIPDATEYHHQQHHQRQGDHVSLGWRPYSGPPEGTSLARGSSVFHQERYQYTPIAPYPGAVQENMSDPSDFDHDHEPFNPF